MLRVPSYKKPYEYVYEGNLRLDKKDGCTDGRFCSRSASASHDDTQVVSFCEKRRNIMKGSLTTRSLVTVVTLLCSAFSCKAFLVTTPSQKVVKTCCYALEDNQDTSWKLPPFLCSLLVSASLAVLPAHAVDPSIYTNDYSDPFHPLCERHIQVIDGGKTFHYSGTAVGPKDDPVRRGCSPEEIAKYKLRQGAFDGSILSNGRLSVGDGIHEGVWEPAGSVKTNNLGYEDVDGIRWNDGNKWVVLKK
jgi:hypothetical protein